MKQLLHTYFAFPKPGFLFLFLFVALLWQPGNAQHCTPGFHFTVEGYNVIFDDQSTADGDITSYSWDFGDGESSDEQNPTHTYASSGTFNVCLTIVAHNPGCTATFCHHVVIHDPPPGNCHAAFTAHQPNPDEQIIDFTDESTSDGTIGSWAWDFGDGNTSSEQDPTHEYAEPGTYLVCLTITDDDGECTNHVCHEITVHHPPAGNCHALYSVHQADPDILTFDFTDQSTSDGTIGSWLWDFGDGNTSTEQNPSHTYSEPGTYHVCLTITDDDEGCSSHFCHALIVHHPVEGVCHASFRAHQNDPEQQIISFTDHSTSDGNITSWFWDFGDGNSSIEQNPFHTYLEAGIYLVCLQITDDAGCTSHVCHHITVLHPPPGVCHALFSANQPNENEFIIDFTDLSTSDGTVVSWLWEFGDGTSSTEQNPSHTYPHAGTYLVCLFITDDDGCTSHFCHHVTLHHIPMDVNNSVQRAAIDDSHFGYKINPPSSPKPTALNPIQLIAQSKLNGENTHEDETYLLVYPNPIIGDATIKYDLAYNADVKLEVYNLLGEIVLQTNNNTQEKGIHSKSFDGKDLQSGSYIIKMIVGGEVFTKKIVVAN